MISVNKFIGSFKIYIEYMIFFAIFAFTLTSFKERQEARWHGEKVWVKNSNWD